MTVGELQKALANFPADMPVIVSDGDREFDVVIGLDTDENLQSAAVIDLTADCERNPE
jgi:hypothetical protein